MIGFVCERVHYDSHVVAHRVCPAHQAILDDDLRCPEGHEADYWEVRYSRDGHLLEQVLHRATEWDGARDGHKPLQPIPTGGRLSERRQKYLNETAWRLRQRHGFTLIEARAEALKRWEARILVSNGLV